MSVPSDLDRKYAAQPTRYRYCISLRIAAPPFLRLDRSDIFEKPVCWKPGLGEDPLSAAL